MPGSRMNHAFAAGSDCCERCICDREYFKETRLWALPLFQDLYLTVEGDAAEEVECGAEDQSNGNRHEC